MSCSHPNFCPESYCKIKEKSVRSDKHFDEDINFGSRLIMGKCWGCECFVFFFPRRKRIAVTCVHVCSRWKLKTLNVKIRYLRLTICISVVFMNLYHASRVSKAQVFHKYLSGNFFVCGGCSSSRVNIFFCQSSYLLGLVLYPDITQFLFQLGICLSIFFSCRLTLDLSNRGFKS